MRYSREGDETRKHSVVVKVANGGLARCYLFDELWRDQKLGGLGLIEIFPGIDGGGKQLMGWRQRSVRAGKKERAITRDRRETHSIALSCRFLPSTYLPTEV